MPTTVPTHVVFPLKRLHMHILAHIDNIECHSKCNKFISAYKCSNILYSRKSVTKNSSEMVLYYYSRSTSLIIPFSICLVTVVSPIVQHGDVCIIVNHVM